MGETAVQKKRGEKTPVFALHNNSVRLQGANPVQNFRVIPIAERDFEQKGGRIKEN